jgi:hypothetical protein
LGPEEIFDADPERHIVVGSCFGSWQTCPGDINPGVRVEKDSPHSDPDPPPSDPSPEDRSEQIGPTRHPTPQLLLATPQPELTRPVSLSFFTVSPKERSPLAAMILLDVCGKTKPKYGNHILKWTVAQKPRFWWVDAKGRRRSHLKNDQRP